MEELIERLRQIAEARGPRGPHVLPYAAELQVFGGYELRLPAHGYYLDGMRRGADPAHPYLVFQYTIEGAGCYAAHGQAHRLAPGMAFTAIIPSEHTYYLPADARRWGFFWVILRHPYIVERIARRQQASGAILEAAPGDALVLRALDLLEWAARPATGDPIAHERVLFEFLWEHERAATRHSTPSETERWLDDVRRYVVARLAHSIAVAELAERSGMSRSHFSHSFRAATGIAPAQFIRQVRLEEATRRLLHGEQPIEAIARDTGFANANHFCKVFRQRFHLSPGAFRRQMR
jgi:AraC-like DNA-binding protein